MAISVESVLQDIAGWIGNLMSKLVAWFKDNLKKATDAIASLVANVSNALNNLTERIGAFVSNIYNDIVSAVSTIMDNAFTFLNSIYDRVAESITSLFDTVTGYIADTFNVVYEQMLGVVDTIKSNIVDIFDAVINKIKSIVTTITDWLGQLLDDVKTSVNNLLDSAVRVVDAIATAIQDWISTVVDVVGDSLRVLLDATSQIPAALSDMGDGFLKAVEEFIGQPLDNLPDDMWKSLTKTFDELHGEEQDEIISSLHESYLSNNSPPKNNDELRSTFAAVVPKSGALRGFFLTLFGVLSSLMSIIPITTANAQVMLQEYAVTSPYALLNPADAIRSNHFGLTSDETTKLILRKHGHDILDADKLLKIGKQSPPEGEALSWFLRGIYTEDDLDKALNKNGWDEQDKAALKEAAHLIPPVQDLITMAVREVFTPEVAERFGQFEEYPEKFGEWAAKTGLTEEWSKNYWASHWALPSPQMGFEMLHRRVIEESDLDLLLKSADVMPFWRQKIVDISYAPYTRVDIRRMHKVGVLNDADIFESYQDIGYDKDKAQRLTDFTIELNGEKSSDDDVGLLELSRTNILGFYEDGLLDKGEATELLLGIGLSPEATNLYLLSVDMNEERADRKAETALILDQAKAGLITFEQGQDKLAELNLETRELSKALTRLIREKTQRTKLPSKGDLTKMLTQDIINDVEFKETLQLLGYSELWTDRLHKLIRSA